MAQNAVNAIEEVEEVAVYYRRIAAVEECQRPPYEEKWKKGAGRKGSAQRKKKPYYIYEIKVPASS